MRKNIFHSEYNTLKNIIENGLLKFEEMEYKKSLYRESINKFNLYYFNNRIDFENTISGAKDIAMKKTIDFLLFESNSRKWNAPISKLRIDRN